MLKKLMLGLLAFGMLGGAAIAFTPGNQSGLNAAGYTQTNSYTYQKTTGACTIKVVESSFNSKYWVYSQGGYKTAIWPVSSNQVLNAANFVENQCLNP